MPYNKILSVHPLRSLMVFAYFLAGVVGLHADAASGLDTSFTSTITGTGITVYAMAVQPDSKIVVGGEFTSTASGARTRIARFEETGALDNLFIPPSITGGSVFAVARQADGRILVGGSFTSPSTGILRLNADGTLDGTFTAPTLNGTSVTVSAIAVDANGKILIGGNFTNVTTGDGKVRSRLARLNSDGTLDTTFQAVSAGTTAALQDGVVYAIVVNGTDVLVGGSFTTAGSSVRNAFACFNSTGTVQAADILANSGSAVRTILVESAGTVILGGSFNSIYGSTYNRIVRLAADLGSVTNTSIGTGPDNTVLSIISDAGTRFYVVGNFTKIDGTQRNRIARLTSTLARDDTFAPAQGANNTVFTVQMQGSRVLLGGSFTSYNLTAVNALARLVGGATTAPTIPTQPANISAAAGSQATFTVTAAGTAPLTYQWAKLVNGIWTNISGATSATYSIPAISIWDASSYRVTVTNDFGNITSNAGTLTVTGVAPIITGQPASLSLALSATANFSATAIGSGNLTYQWRKNGVAIGGATASTYTIAAVVAGDSADYSVVVTNADGSATSSNATLVVQAAPQIITQPRPQDAVIGQSVSFSVVAAGSPPLSYQWKKDGVAIGGATGSTYTIASVAESHIGTYTVEVTAGAFGTTTSDGTATLAVRSTLSPATAIGLPITADPNNVWRVETFTTATEGTLAPLLRGFVTAGTGPTLATSPNTAAWTAQASTAPGTLRACLYKLGRLYAVGDAGTIVASTDGAAWAAQTSNAGANNLHFIFANDNTFIAGGAASTLVLSSDGYTWNTRTSPVPGVILRAGAYGTVSYAGQTQTRYVVVGDNGTIITSSDGETWTNRSPTIAGLSHLYAICYQVTSTSPSGRFIAVGAGGKAVTSTDGYSWSALTSGTAQDLNGITFFQSKWVAVGNGGTVLTSADDGANWSAQTSNTANNLLAVTVGGDLGNKLVAVGANGTCVVSTDATTWAASTAVAGQTLNAVCYGRSTVSRTPTLGTGAQSYMQASVNLKTPQLLTFYWRATGTTNSDFINVSVNGVVQNTPDSANYGTPTPLICTPAAAPNPWQSAQVLLKAGPNVIRWTFTCGSGDLNAAGYVDQVRFDPLPSVDLELTEVSFTPGTFMLRDTQGTGRLNFTATVNNLGKAFTNGAFQNVHLSLHLSLNGTYGDGDDIPLGYYDPINVYGQGDMMVFGAMIDLPDNIPAGNYFLLMRVESTVTSPGTTPVTEFTLTNNSWASGSGSSGNVTIVRAPDLQVGTISRNFSLFRNYYCPGERIPLTFDIENVGLGTVTPLQPFKVKITLHYVDTDVNGNVTWSAAMPNELDTFTISAYLPEASADFPTGSRIRVNYMLTVPSLRDLVVFLIPSLEGTPEDAGSIGANKGIINTGTRAWGIRITVDSDNAIQEYSETNVFSVGTLFRLSDPPASETFAAYSTNMYGAAYVFANDQDGDGMANGMEYALGTDVRTNDSYSPAVGYEATMLGGVEALVVPPSATPTNYLTYTFDFNNRASDITIRVQSSPDLAAWSDVLVLTPPYLSNSGATSLSGFGGLSSQANVISVTGHPGYVTHGGTYTARIHVRDSVPVPAVGSRYMRVLVTSP